MKLASDPRISSNQGLHYTLTVKEQFKDLKMQGRRAQNMGVDGEKTQNRIGRLPRLMTKSVKNGNGFRIHRRM